MDSTYGEINSTQFQGFSYGNVQKTKEPLISLFGVSIRKKENTTLLIHFDRESKKIVGIKYNP